MECRALVLSTSVHWSWGRVWRLILKNSFSREKVGQSHLWAEPILGPFQHPGASLLPQPLDWPIPTCKAPMWPSHAHRGVQCRVWESIKPILGKAGKQQGSWRDSAFRQAWACLVWLQRLSATSGMRYSDSPPPPIRFHPEIIPIWSFEGLVFVLSCFVFWLFLGHS